MGRLDVPYQELGYRSNPRGSETKEFVKGNPAALAGSTAPKSKSRSGSCAASSVTDSSGGKPALPKLLHQLAAAGLKMATHKSRGNTGMDTITCADAPPEPAPTCRVKNEEDDVFCRTTLCTRRQPHALILLQARLNLTHVVASATTGVVVVQ